ncbi:MAG TPA: flippase, partial [Bryobacteraceae bacterium]|nr:flippase [Bryobacteraceae bacterium]
MPSQLVTSGMNLLRHRLVKNTAALFLVQVSTYIAPFLVVPYLSRVLSTEHYGLINFATSFNWYFMTLVDYGFNLTATRRIAIHRDDPEKISKIFSSVMAAKTLLTVLGFLVMATVVMVTPKLRQNFPLFCLAYLQVLGDLLFPLWLFQGLQKMENLVWRDLVSKLIALALVFAFVHRDSDYLLAAGFQFGSTLFAGIVGICTVPFLTSARWVLPSFQEVWTALCEGWPVFLSVAGVYLTDSTNILVLGLRSGPSDVAYYTASARLVVAARSLIGPVVTAIYPHISHMAENAREDAIVALRKYSLVLVAPFLAGSIVLLVGASPIIRIVSSAKYIAAIPLLRVMAFSPALLALQHVFSTFFMLAFGYEKDWSKIIMQSTVLNFVV